MIVIENQVLLFTIWFSIGLVIFYFSRASTRHNEGSNPWLSVVKDGSESNPYTIKRSALFLREWLHMHGIESRNSNSSLSDLKRQVWLYLRKKDSKIQSDDPVSLEAYEKYVRLYFNDTSVNRGVIEGYSNRSDDKLITRARGRFKARYEIAIVLPFRHDDIVHIVAWLKRLYDMPACETRKAINIKSDYIFHFVWAYDGDLSNTPSDKVLSETLQFYWEQYESASCFNTVSFISLNLSSSDGRFDSVCGSFYTLVYALKDRFDSFYLLDTDSTPVQRNWLEGLAKQVSMRGSCSKWWIQGSLSMCSTAFASIDTRSDYHIFRNALYTLNCYKFEKFLTSVQRYYPALQTASNRIARGCGTGRPFEVGFDHAMYQYCLEPENFAYCRVIRSKFQISTYLINLCKDLYTAEDDILSNPATYWVQSESTILSERVKYLLKKSYQLDSTATTDIAPNLLTSLKTALPRVYSGEARHDAVTDWRKAFPGKLYIWSVDFHSGPINCQMPIFTDAGAVVHAEIGYENCRHHGFCTDRLKVLKYDGWSGFSLECGKRDYASNMALFYETYKDDLEFKRVDAFICSHPAANCQLFMRFNKTIIIYATTRLEFGRHDGGVSWRWPYWTQAKGEAMWSKWASDLQVLARSPRNIIAANSLYDKHYIKYFTGVDAEYIPSWCGDVPYEYESLHVRSQLRVPYPHYSPSKAAYLIAPYRNNLDASRDGKRHPLRDHPIIKALISAESQYLPSTLTIDIMQEVFAKGYTYLDLVLYRGIIILPYQVSTISIFEFYRLNIPLFFPSKRLLLQWFTDDDTFMWERIYGWPERVGSLDSASAARPNPNSNTNESFSYWIDFADWFVLPYITYFDSFPHLMELLQSTPTLNISLSMRQYNEAERKAQVKKWRNLFSRIDTKA